MRTSINGTGRVVYTASTRPPKPIPEHISEQISSSISAIGQSLRAYGMDWNDVADALVVPQQYALPIEEGSTSTDYSGEPASDFRWYKPAEILAIIEAIEARDFVRAGGRDDGFLKQIRGYCEQYPVVRLSLKQDAWLHGLDAMSQAHT